MSKTLYYKISVSGPTYGNTPPQQPLTVNGVKVSGSTYDSHWDSNGSLYFTRKVEAVSFTKPADYETATYSIDHAEQDHSPGRAWSSTSVPDDTRLPPDIDKTDPSKLEPAPGSGGFGGGWTKALGGYGVSVTGVSFFNSIEFNGLKASAGESAIDFLKGVVIDKLPGNLGTQVSNALNIKAAMTQQLQAQLDVIKIGMDNLSSPNPTMTPEQYAALADKTLAGSAAAYRKALEDHVMFPGNPAAEQVADATLAGVRTASEVVGGQGLDIKASVDIEFGEVLKVNVFEGTIHADIMVIGEDASTATEAGAGNDTVLGGSGNDAVWGEAGDDFIYGGGGVDTANYAGVRRSYAATPTSVGGPEGNDRLLAVERIKFTDGEYAVGPVGTLTWTVNQKAAVAARVYDATLDRRADAAGLKFWADGLENGGTAKAMVDGFTASPEFQSKYGALDNAAFVDRIYRNVLDRPSDPEGAKFWLNGLNSGAASRADVVLGFSESPENVARMAPFIDDGIWVV